MKPAAVIALVLVVFVASLILGDSLYIVNMTEQVIITQFGKPTGEPIQTPGLKWKTPFVQKANFLSLIHI